MTLGEDAKNGVIARILFTKPDSRKYRMPNTSACDLISAPRERCDPWLGSPISPEWKGGCVTGELAIDPDVFEVGGLGEVGGHAAVSEGDGFGEGGAEL